MTSQKQDCNLKHLVYLFRLIVTKDPKAVTEVAKTIQTEPSLLTRALEFPCGNIFDSPDTGCACVLDHETFTYFSGEKINSDVFNHIIESVVRGECIHHDSIPEEDEETVGPQPTSVNLIHAAAVVGYTPVLETLLKLSDEAVLTQSLRASPLHLAILFNQRSSIETIVKQKASTLKMYSSTFCYTRRDAMNSNIIDYDFVSVFKLCMLMDDFTTAEMILNNTSLAAEWAIVALRSKSEKTVKLIIPYMDDSFINQLSNDQAVALVRCAIEQGLIEIASKLLDRMRHQQWGCNGVSLALLATLCNEPEILQLILTTDVDDGNIDVLGHSLLDISRIIGHTDCSRILNAHGIKPSSKREDVSPLVVIIEITRRHSCQEMTDLLIRKAGSQSVVSDRKMGGETLILYSLRHKRGLGAKGLLTLSNDIEVKGLDGLTPLALAMKHDINPYAMLDILYFNPVLSEFEIRGEERTRTERHLQLYDRSKVKNISMLALAIERDLKNYSVRKWALCYSGFKTYEGSISVLLLDCGYDVRNDELIHSSYATLIKRWQSSAREEEIRTRILNRIETELFRTKPLKDRCRDVIRRTFTGHSLHRFVGAVKIPPTVKDFILMEERLKTLR